MSTTTANSTPIPKTFGTKLAQNPKYGRPSGKKLRIRQRNWREERSMIENNWVVYYESNWDRFNRIHDEVENSSRLFNVDNKDCSPMVRLCKLIGMINL
jgi:hypothetical protein